MRLALITCDGEPTVPTDVEPSCEEGCRDRELLPCRERCEQACGDDLQCLDVCSRDCQIASDQCIADECS